MRNKVSIGRTGLGVAAALLLCWRCDAAAPQSVTVSSVGQLADAVANANSAGGNVTILVASGVYTLTSTLNVTAPNVTISGQSGNRTDVVIQGDAMSSTAQIGNVLRVSGSNFQLHNVTLQRSGWHLIQIAGEANADSPVISNCILRDSYEQLLKVSNDPTIPGVASDGGLVENCLFEYTAGVGPEYYIGGIDAHGSRNWTVRNNTFRYIISPSSSVAEFAVHFWDGSANNTVERNTVVDCDRGIGFGLDGQGNSGGIIRNNMLYHSASNGAFADVSIALTDSPGSQVYNNTVYMENGFQWAIEYRFSDTTGVLIANNLTNKPVMDRDGAAGTVTSNATGAVASWFVNPAAGDLHLSRAVSGVVDAGQTIPGLVDDFDGQSRPQGAAIDIGADEYIAAAVVPKPPTNVQVN